jgi:DNA modification methylase
LTQQHQVRHGNSPGVRMIYHETEHGILYCGDCLDIMKTLPDNSVDAVVTDPPYGLGFMGKKWDYDVPGVDIWRECLRVLKPGGYLLSFAGTRTQHRIACGIEDAGFEIRDMIAWVYGSGFPKSLNVGNGYGTALKPAHEPITVARKPIEGTVAANVLKWGTGAINIDGCRVEYQSKIDSDSTLRANTPNAGRYVHTNATNIDLPPAMKDYDPSKGRFPANLIHDGSDAVLEMFPETGKSSGGRIGNKGSALNMCGNEYEAGDPGFGDSGSAARFFYKAPYTQEEQCFVNTAEKSSSPQKRAGDSVLSLVAIERCHEGRPLNATIQPFMSAMRSALKQNSETNTTTMLNTGQRCLQELRRMITEGLSHSPVKYVEIQLLTNTMMIIQSLMNTDGFAEAVMSDTMLLNMVLGEADCRRFNYCAKASKAERQAGNNHPTVKPIALMRYLIKLVTPPNGTVLDPFLGSGTTAIAAVLEGFDWIGIEREAEYCDIAVRRIETELNQTDIFREES